MKKKITRILGVGFVLAIASTLLLAAFPVAADVSQPQVTVDPDTISATAEYVILFSVNDEIPNDGTGEIVVTFDEDTTMGPFTTLGDVEVQSTAGFGTANINTQIPAADVTVVDETVTINIDILANPIGEFAQVKVTFTDDVTNPDTPGDYTLDVSTSEETDEVTSASFEIEIPDLGDLPGIVKVFNASGIQMAQYTGTTAIADAIAAAGEDFEIEIGPGTYVEDPITADDGVTFIASGAQANTIIEGMWDIDNADITLDGLTIRGEGYIGTSAENVLITDCLFEKLDDDNPETLLEYEFSGDGTIEDCTFDTTEGDEDDVGLYIDYDGLTVSNCIFMVDEDDWGIELYYDATIEDCTFEGSSGIGIYFEDDVGIIDGNTFDGLENAIYIYWADVGSEITNNTIMNSTGDAIYIEDTDPILIANNTITDTDEDFYALYVDDYDENVYFIFNNVTGNAGNVNNADDSDPVAAMNNWWGDADGPDDDSIEGDVDTTPWARAPITGAHGALMDDELDAKDEAGIKIDVDGDALADNPEILGGAMYDGNPFTDTPLPALSDGFRDVFAHGIDVDGDDVTESLTVRIYNDDVDANTRVYVWNELGGVWAEASDQGISTFGGYAFFKVEEEDTLPVFEDLEGIPVALLTAPEAAPPVLQLTAPAPGGTDTLLANVPFTWTSVATATDYKVVVSASATMSPALATATASGTAYTYAGPLEYSSAYYWQVTALEDGDIVAISDIATFTTMAEPAPPPEPPVVNIPVQPTQPQPVVEVTEITPAWIWAVIAIGAVLVIAMIVLIVRTRRVS